MGALDYDTYRQRRNSIIDEYAGVEKRLSNSNSPKATDIHHDKVSRDKISHDRASHDRVSPYRAVFTLGLVLLAVIITYVAIKDDNSGKVEEMKDQFVDSRQLPENTRSGTSP